MVKHPPGNVGDINSGSVLGSGRYPGGGHDNPLQYSCLENSMDKGAWEATIQGVTKSQTKLSTVVLYFFIFLFIIIDIIDKYIFSMKIKYET